MYDGFFFLTSVHLSSIWCLICYRSGKSDDQPDVTVSSGSVALPGTRTGLIAAGTGRIIEPL